jgi:hypothetical protein
MSSHGVAMTPPGLNDGPGFFQGLENLAIRKFVAPPGIEALDEAGFPRVKGLQQVCSVA